DADGRNRAQVVLGRWCSVDGIQVLYTPTLVDRPFSPRLLARLPALIQWADVVHVTGVYEHHTIPALAMCAVAKRPVVWSPRGSLQRWPNARRRTAKMLWERACVQVAPSRTVIHATSASEARAVVERLGDVNVAVVPNGVELPVVAPPLPQHEILHILFLGRLDAIKGLDCLLDAGQLLLTQGFDKWMMIVAGRGARVYEASLAAYSRKLGLTQHVRFVGWADETRRTELLGIAD